MSDQMQALQETIAGVLYAVDSNCEWVGLRPGDEDRQWYLDAAASVLDALGLEQVGFWCSNGQPYLVLGSVIHEQDGHQHEPVYRVAASGRVTEAGEG